MVTSHKCTSAQNKQDDLHYIKGLYSIHNTENHQFYMTKFHFYVYYNVLNIPTDVQHMYKTHQVTLDLVLLAIT